MLARIIKKKVKTVLILSLVLKVIHEEDAKHYEYISDGEARLYKFKYMSVALTMPQCRLFHC